MAGTLNFLEKEVILCAIHHIFGCLESKLNMLVISSKRFVLELDLLNRTRISPITIFKSEPDLQKDDSYSLDGCHLDAKYTIRTSSEH